MIQDIFPEIFHNEYKPKPVADNSLIFCFCDNKVLCNLGSSVVFPLYSQIKCSEYIYLFSLNDCNCFLAKDDIQVLPEGFDYIEIPVFRSAVPRQMAFLGITAHHIFHWYAINRFCGRCKNPMKHSDIERMVECSSCGNLVYPRISPVVIVGVTNKDKLLLIRGHNSQPGRYGLTAGYIEIGETAEQAASREVFEETGIRIKNIRYYKSQPWGLSESLLFGFFADLDGDDTITIDPGELTEAVFMEKEKINVTFDNFSLTNEMICHFKGLV